MSATAEIIDVSRCAEAYVVTHRGWLWIAALAMILSPFWFDSGTRPAILASCALAGLSWSVNRLRPIAALAFAAAVGGLTIWFIVSIDLWRNGTIMFILIAFGAMTYLGRTARAVFIYRKCQARRHSAELIQSTSKINPISHLRWFRAGRVARRVGGGTLLVLALGILTFGFSVLLVLWQSKDSLFFGVEFTPGDIKQFIWNDPRFTQFIVLLVIGAGLVRLGFWLQRYSRRYRMLSAEEATQQDSRRPILILRSFEDDMLEVERDSEGVIEKVRQLTGSRGPVFEEAVAEALSAFGPVIAIGKPGEKLPALGAAREYVSHDEWQERAVELISRSSIVTVVLGKGQWLQWEIKKLVELGGLDKALVVFPPVKSNKLVERWKIVGPLLNVNDGWLRVLRRDQRPMATTFKRAGKPVFIVASSRKDTFYREAVLEAADGLLNRTKQLEVPVTATGTSA